MYVGVSLHTVRIEITITNIISLNNKISCSTSNQFVLLLKTASFVLVNDKILTIHQLLAKAELTYVRQIFTLLLLNSRELLLSQLCGNVNSYVFRTLYFKIKLLRRVSTFTKWGGGTNEIRDLQVLNMMKKSFPQ